MPWSISATARSTRFSGQPRLQRLRPSEQRHRRAELRRLRYFGQRQRDRVRRSAGHRRHVDDLYVRAEWRVHQSDQPLQLRADQLLSSGRTSATPRACSRTTKSTTSIKPYLEFMFMDDRTVAQIAPSGDFGNTLTINCDNPADLAGAAGDHLQSAEPDQRLPRDLPDGGRRALQSELRGTRRSTSSIRRPDVPYQQGLLPAAAPQRRRRSPPSRPAAHQFPCRDRLQGRSRQGLVL